MRFDNQVAIITGAAQGLGRGYAMALAERGAKVVLIDKPVANASAEESTINRQSSLLDSLALVKQITQDVLAIELDVSDAASTVKAIDRVIAHWGRVDILINNAGVHTPCSFESITLSQWRQQIDVDLSGSFYLTKAVWPHMKQQGYGRIIMSSGVSALYGDIFETAYSVANMGLIGLVNSLHLEGAEFNVHVNSLSPHALTSMTDKHLAQSVKPLFSHSSVNSAVLFLSAKEAPNGQHLLAAAGSISHGQFAEFKPVFYQAGQCTPEAIAADWPVLNRALPVQLHASGEDQVLGWSKRGASAHQISID